MALAASEPLRQALEEKVPGLKPCFGGEELNRAMAALTGNKLPDGGESRIPTVVQSAPAVTASPAAAREQPHLHLVWGEPPPTAFAEAAAAAAAAAVAATPGGQRPAPDSHTRDLLASSRAYAATASAGAAAACTDNAYELHYAHGLVEQELAAGAPPTSQAHRAHLEAAVAAYRAAIAAQPASPAALYNIGVALTDLARAIKAAKPPPAPPGRPPTAPAPAAPAAAPTEKQAADPAAVAASGVAGEQTAGSVEPQRLAADSAAAAGERSGLPRPSHGAPRAPSPFSSPGTASAVAAAAAAVGSASPPLLSPFGYGLAASRRCLAAAADAYAAALRWQPANPQSLNNWGLVLQELSLGSGQRTERDALVRCALDKFRCALRLRPDFDRGCYNLGTVCYTYAGALQAELASTFRGQQDAQAAASKATREVAVRTLFATAAQYICLAHALQQHKDIYRRSRLLVRTLLPLPFLRVGHLVGTRGSGTGGGNGGGVVVTLESWQRDWYVLDHHSLRVATPLEEQLSSSAAAGAPSAATAAARPASAASGTLPGLGAVSVALEDVLDVRRCADPSLPLGSALWLNLRNDPLGLYLVADSSDAADAWVDCVLLAAYIVRTRGEDSLADALAPS